MSGNSSCCSYSYENNDLFSQTSSWVLWLFGAVQNMEFEEENGLFRKREELGKSRNSLVCPLFSLTIIIMRISSLYSVQVPGVWVPWLWAYCGEISFYWLPSGTSQLCLWFYIPYQVIFTSFFGLKSFLLSSRLIIPNASLTMLTFKEKNQKRFFGLFLVVVFFLVDVDSKITMDFSCASYLLCSWIELSLLLLKIYLWERRKMIKTYGQSSQILLPFALGEQLHALL